MSNCVTVGWGKCACCGKPVAVKRNKSKMAYFRCDHCGVHVQHHWQRTSDKALAEVGFAGEEPAPVEPAAVDLIGGEKPQKAAPKKPAPGSLASMFGG